MTVDAVRYMHLVDARHHLWDPARPDYQRLAQPALAAIRRPYGRQELRSRTAANAVTATMLVQTVSDPGETEEFLIPGQGRRRAPGSIAGVVGWVDLTAPGRRPPGAARRDHLFDSVDSLVS